MLPVMEISRGPAGLSSSSSVFFYYSVTVMNRSRHSPGGSRGKEGDNRTPEKLGLIHTLFASKDLLIQSQGFQNKLAQASGPWSHEVVTIICSLKLKV